MLVLAVSDRPVTGNLGSSKNYQFVFLVLQTSKPNVLSSSNLKIQCSWQCIFCSNSWKYIIFMIELFHGFVFVLLHFEMELVIRLGFYSYCCCNYNLGLILFGVWLPRK